MGNVTRAAELNGWLRMQRFTHRLHFATDEAVLGEVLKYFASSKNNKNCYRLRSVIGAFMKSSFVYLPLCVAAAVSGETKANQTLSLLWLLIVYNREKKISEQYLFHYRRRISGTFMNVSL